MDFGIMSVLLNSSFFTDIFEECTECILGSTIVAYTEDQLDSVYRSGKS